MTQNLYSTVEEVRDVGELTGEEMCEIIYHFHRCVDFKPYLTPKQIWKISPSGELWPVIIELQVALSYFEKVHEGKIVRHPLPENRSSNQRVKT